MTAYKLSLNVEAEKEWFSSRCRGPDDKICRIVYGVSFCQKVQAKTSRSRYTANRLTNPASAPNLSRESGEGGIALYTVCSASR
jgi:hypothetical protein